jgi:hypothetical protein
MERGDGRSDYSPFWDVAIQKYRHGKNKLPEVRERLGSYGLATVVGFSCPAQMLSYSTNCRILLRRTSTESS